MTGTLQLVHATTIAIAGKGIMLRGPSGSGKSDLALRLIEQPGTGLGSRVLQARLVADDQTVVYLRAGRLWVRCPKTIKGKLEVRGLGILNLKAHAACPLALVVDLLPGNRIERMPEEAHLTDRLLHHPVSRICLDPHLPSAPSVLRAAFRHLSG